MDSGDAPAPTHFERRKAQTRARIVDAADRLFRERGYRGTSVEDIASAAGVGVRTIYLHFESKAAILLAYFDDWLDAFTAEFAKRPAREPVADAVRASLDALVAAGWEDQPVDQMTQPHPVVEFLTGGGTEVAGHVLQSLMRTQRRLVAAAGATTFEDEADARTRAAGFVGAWLGSVLLVADRVHDAGALPPDATGNTLGVDLLRRLTGERQRPPRSPER